MLNLKGTLHAAMLEIHVTTYKCLTLIAPVAITELELPEFTRASEVVTRAETQRTVASAHLGRFDRRWRLRLGRVMP